METKNVLLVAALAGLTLTAQAKSTKKVKADTKAKEEKVAEKKDEKAVEGHCSGINSCKGTSACHSEKNQCGGMNSCKGQGWLKTSEKECSDKKGTFKKS
jgi:hypothetical protein